MKKFGLSLSWQQTLWTLLLVFVIFQLVSYTSTSKKAGVVTRSGAQTSLSLCQKEYTRLNQVSMYSKMTYLGDGKFHLEGMYTFQGMDVEYSITAPSVCEAIEQALEPIPIQPEEVV